MLDDFCVLAGVDEAASHAGASVLAVEPAL
jgi:hypothetical protein